MTFVHGGRVYRASATKLVSLNVEPKPDMPIFDAIRFSVDELYQNLRRNVVLPIA